MALEAEIEVHTGADDDAVLDETTPSHVHHLEAGGRVRCTSYTPTVAIPARYGRACSSLVVDSVVNGLAVSSCVCCPLSVILLQEGNKS